MKFGRDKVFRAYMDDLVGELAEWLKENNYFLEGDEAEDE